MAGLQQRRGDPATYYINYPPPPSLPPFQTEKISGIGINIYRWDRVLMQGLRASGRM